MNILHAGPFIVYPYALALAAGTALSLLVMKSLRAKFHLKAETVEWFFLFAIPFSILGARILYFLVSITWFIDRGIGTFFHFSEGGYMLYGAMAGTAAAAWLAGRVTHQAGSRILDCAAAPFALITAVARGAEYLVGIGLGEYTEEWFDPDLGRSFIQLEDSSFFQRFPFSVQDADGYWRFPVFLLEMLVALLIFLILLRVRTRREGTQALLFLAMYAGLQAFLESLRIDLELRWGFVKINQLMALPAMAVIFAVCVFRTPRNNRTLSLFAKPAGGILLCCGVIMAMEFALEQKIGFLTWMRMDLCWIIMMAAAVVMAWLACGMIRKSDLSFPEPEKTPDGRE